VLLTELVGFAVGGVLEIVMGAWRGWYGFVVIGEWILIVVKYEG